MKNCEKEDVIREVVSILIAHSMEHHIEQYGWKNPKTTNEMIESMVEWFLAEYQEPIKLTKFEYETLKRMLSVGRERVCRATNCNNIVFGGVICDYLRNDFKFIEQSEEETRSVKDILDNAEVAEE